MGREPAPVAVDTGSDVCGLFPGGGVGGGTKASVKALQQAASVNIGGGVAASKDTLYRVRISTRSPVATPNPIPQAPCVLATGAPDHLSFIISLLFYCFARCVRGEPRLSQPDTRSTALYCAPLHSTPLCSTA